MTSSKLTKPIVDNANPRSHDYEIRDTETPGFLVKITPSGRKTFMVQYRTEGGERRKPAIGLYGQVTTQQARNIAKDWLARVRQGEDPSLDRKKLRKNPTMRELCPEFIERHA